MVEVGEKKNLNLIETTVMSVHQGIVQVGHVIVETG